jgi:hypothetical protein
VLVKNGSVHPPLTRTILFEKAFIDPRFKSKNCLTSFGAGYISFKCHVLEQCSFRLGPDKITGAYRVKPCSILELIEEAFIYSAEEMTSFALLQSWLKMSSLSLCGFYLLLSGNLIAGIRELFATSGLSSFFRWQWPGASFILCQS